MGPWVANLSMLFPELPMMARFAAARRAGFEAVECQFPYDWPAEALREAADAEGLPWVLINLPAGDWAGGERGIACLPGREAEFEAGIDRALSYAKVLGVQQLNCLAGLEISPEARPLQQQVLLKNLTTAARAFHTCGLTLLIEPINTIDVPGFFVSRAEGAIDLIHEVAQPNVALQYDIYHAVRMQADVLAEIKRYHSQIRHVQFADAQGRHQPGCGTIPFLPFFQLLKNQGYQGALSAEYVPEGENAYAWLPAFRAALR